MQPLLRLCATALAAATVSASLLAHDGDPKMLDRRPMYPGPGWRNAQRQPAGGGGSLAVGVTPFAANNATLLSWLSLPDLGVPSGGNGNSCFGYVSPSGREYAIMGTSEGTSFVEVTNPGNAQVVAQVPGPQSLWRDMRVFQNYCYAISEGGSGIQVIDLSNIDNGVATLVNTITTGGTTATHTLEINTQSGYLFRAGGGTNGLRIYNLNVTPASPQYVGTWPARYVHECQAVTYPTGGPGGGPRQLVICCGGLNSGFDDVGIDIVDVTNPAAPVSIGHFGYTSSGFSHQAWLSPDRQYLFHNDETDNLPRTRVFNASNINSATPTLPYLGFFTNGTTVDHNIYTKGSLLFESNYRSGLRVFDTTSGVLTPTLYASFDTYPEDDASGYNGLWNNYPYLPSGVVIASDIERGLFVLWVGPAPIAFTPAPTSQPGTINPNGESVGVQVVESPAGSLQPGSAKLYVSTNNGPYAAIDLVQVAGSSYVAEFPPVPCGATVSYYFAGTSTSGVVWSSPADAPSSTFTVVAATSLLTSASVDFEASAAGWVGSAAGDTATAGQWARGNPTGTEAQSEDDHTAGAGVNCWATGLAGGSIGNADVDNGRTTLVSAAYDVTGATLPRIGYWRWYVNDGNTAVDDSFRVDVSNNGTTWVNVETLPPGHPEASGGWYYHEFTVSDFVTPTSTVRVRFVAEDVGTGSIVEAAIDDFVVRDVGCNGAGAFCFGDGSGADCPCGNFGAAGTGCANSTGAGAELLSSGVASIGADTFALTSDATPAVVSVLFFQGTSAQSGGAGVVFGDGLRCVAGSIIRLGTKVSSASLATYPEAGDATVSVRGAVPAGGVRFYQAWYRNAASFCTSDTFNLTNGVATTWAP